MKVCFLASGSGGNMKFLYLAQKLGLIKNIDLSVISDRDCDSFAFAKQNNIFTKRIKYQKAANKELQSTLFEINPDVIITNWYKVIDEEIVDYYSGKLINLHYSLLPSFGGLIGIKPIEEAYKKGCNYTGGTCHYVDKGVDTGKIIAQTIVKTDITIKEATQKVFCQTCLILLNSLLLISEEKGIIEFKSNSKFHYSPSLKFDDEVFTSDFWKRLSEL